MTERTTKPTVADVFNVVQEFADNYHALHQSLEKHDADSKRDRANLRERLAAIQELVNTLQGQIDRRFDITFKEIDHVHRAVITLQVDVTELRTQATMRLDDHDARLGVAEAASDDHGRTLDDHDRFLRELSDRVARLEQERPRPGQSDDG